MQKPLLAKFGFILLITLLLLIALQLIEGTVNERMQYQRLAKANITESWTGPQEILGPVMVAPYRLEWTTEAWSSNKREKIRVSHSESGNQYLLPGRLSHRAGAQTALRQKGIFQMPVYTADIAIEGEFDPASMEPVNTSHIHADDLTVIHGKPFLSVGIRDARGINNIPVLTWNDEDISFEAGSRLNYLPEGLHAPVSWISKEAGVARFSFNLSLRGIDQILFHPTALNYELSVESPWPHPSFVGKFLPLDRAVGEQGFSARWFVTAFASNVSELVNQCARNNCALTPDAAFGVNFIEPVDIYLQGERSIKYGLLFITLVFAAFFVFEVLQKLPIHPVQYLLVGAAIAIFYLLLISLSEHLSFLVSYVSACLSCVSLISFYLRYVLRSASVALVFGTLLLTIYGMLYVIVSAEDYALLMGSGLLFLVLACIMLATRQVDWYTVDIKT